MCLSFMLVTFQVAAGNVQKNNLSERIEVVRVHPDRMIKVYSCFIRTLKNLERCVLQNWEFSHFRKLFVLARRQILLFACAILHFMKMRNLKRSVMQNFILEFLNCKGCRSFYSERILSYLFFFLQKYVCQEDGIMVNVVDSSVRPPPHSATVARSNELAVVASF